MRVCFTSDLHGSRTLYRQLVELVRAQTPDLLILGGDLVRDLDREKPAEAQLADIHRDLFDQVTACRSAFPPLVVACVAGNHELLPTVLALDAAHAHDRLVLLNPQRPWRFGGYTWVGYACAPPSPHWAKDFERLDMHGDAIPEFPGVRWDQERRELLPVTAADWFAQQATLVDELATLHIPADPWILVAHAPPHGTNLDRLPAVKHPIGSRAVRQLIERTQPRVSLHGHVHESPQLSGAYTDQLGPTLCVNPGQEHERLCAVLFDLDRPTETLRHTVYG